MNIWHWLLGALCLGIVAFASTQSHPREGWQERPLICDPKKYPDDLKGWSECKEWIENVGRPDEEGSCCGEGDAFQADAFEEKDGEFIAIITQDYPGGSFDDGEGGSYSTKPLPKGTRIAIPKHKVNRAYTEDGRPIKHGRNPTGHGIVFLRNNGEVLCYFGPTLAMVRP